MAARRVAFVITGLGVGGAETQLLRIAGALDRDRYEPLVLPLAGDVSLMPAFEAAGIRVFPNAARGGNFHPKRAIAVVRQLRALQPDLIQGWMYHGNFAASLGKLFIGRDTPLLWSVRGMNATQPDLRLSSRLVYAAGAKLAKTPRWIVNNSLASAIAHEEACGYPSDRRVVIPNGFDTDRFVPDAQAGRKLRARLQVPAEVPLVGTIARYHPDKDIDNLLLAVARLQERKVSAHFAIAGKGLDAANAELAGRIEALGIGARVSLLGPVTDTAGTLAAMDLVVSSSMRENFPNVLGEAMSCGVPCVATDVGDCALLVGSTGGLAPPGDAAALAAAIERMLALPAVERRALGEKARQRVVGNFALPAIAKRFEALYDETLAEARG